MNISLFTNFFFPLCRELEDLHAVDLIIKVKMAKDMDVKCTLFS